MTPVAAARRSIAVSRLGTEPAAIIIGGMSWLRVRRVARPLGTYPRPAGGAFGFVASMPASPCPPRATERDGWVGKRQTGLRGKPRPASSHSPTLAERRLRVGENGVGGTQSFTGRTKGTRPDTPCTTIFK